MRLPVNRLLPLAVLVLLNGCISAGGSEPQLPPPAKNGPAADYPMVIGKPFTIDGVTYTPVDKLNYDAVGYASVGDVGKSGITGAHKILPLPSYVEVTSLTTGKTILVRLEDRGPMSNDLLIELSPEAAAQLGISGGAPVRVRRVNPPESDRALLRSGKEAPERMETPKPLLNVLMRKLKEKEPLAPPKSAPKPEPSPAATPAPQPEAKPTPEPKRIPEPLPMRTPKAKPLPQPSPAPSAEPETRAKPEPATSSKPEATGSLYVQAAAFSTKERADKAAARIGGSVSKPGKYWLMRLGPFKTRADAQAALAKAKAAGYSDARILRLD